MLEHVRTTCKQILRNSDRLTPRGVHTTLFTQKHQPRTRLATTLTHDTDMRRAKDILELLQRVRIRPYPGGSHGVDNRRESGVDCIETGGGDSENENRYAGGTGIIK